MMLNAHFLLMSLQATWLPMMTAVVMLVVGHWLSARASRSTRA